jgi:hypothetical protein
MKRDYRTGDLLSVKRKHLVTGLGIAFASGLKGFWRYITGQFIATHSATLYWGLNGVMMIDEATHPKAQQLPLIPYLKRLRREGSKYRIRKVGQMINPEILKARIKEHKDKEYPPIVEVAASSVDLKPYDIKTEMCSERFLLNSIPAGANWLAGWDPENTTPDELDKLAKRAARKYRKKRKLDKIIKRVK